MTEDPEIARARIFVRTLEVRACELAPQIQRAHRSKPASGPELTAELVAVRGYIDHIQRRFPETSADAST